MTEELRPFSRHSASEALIAEQRRVRGSRASIARVLTRRRLRRRVLPPLAVGSMVLMGTGAAGIWVHGIVEPSTSKISSTASTSDPSANIQQATLDQLRQQIAADEATLAALTGGHVPAGLAQAIATAAAVTGTQPAQPGQNAQPARQGQPTAAQSRVVSPAAGGNAGAPAATTKASSGSAGGAAAPGPGAGAPPAAGQPAQPTTAPAPAPQPTAAPAPTPAPKPVPAPTTAAPAPPPPPPPTVHATSGASGGHG